MIVQNTISLQVDIKSLNVWYTKLNFSGDSTVFKKLPPVKVSDKVGFTAVVKLI